MAGDETSGRDNREISTVRVVINGEEYPIKGPDPHEHIKNVARYVDAKMKEISKGTFIPSTAHSAVLAALNIADEKFKADQEIVLLEDKTSENIHELVGKINKILGR